MASEDAGKVTRHEFEVELSTDRNGMIVARAVDPISGHEIDNYVAQTERMALLGLEESLLARTAPKKKTTIVIEVPEEES